MGFCLSEVGMLGLWGQVEFGVATGLWIVRNRWEQSVGADLAQVCPKRESRPKLAIVMASSRQPALFISTAKTVLLTCTSIEKRSKTHFSHEYEPFHNRYRYYMVALLPCSSLPRLISRTETETPRDINDESRACDSIVSYAQVC